MLLAYAVQALMHTPPPPPHPVLLWRGHPSATILPVPLNHPVFTELTLQPGPGLTERDLQVPPAQVDLLKEDPEAPQYTSSPVGTCRTCLGDSVTPEGRGRTGFREAPAGLGRRASLAPSRLHKQGPCPTNAGTEGDRGGEGR